MKTYQDVKLVMPDWILNSGVTPNLPDETYITVLMNINDEDTYLYGKVEDIDWAILGFSDDIIAYVVGDIRGMI